MVDTMDPDFIDEMQAEQLARSDHELFSIAKPDDETRQRQAARKAAIVKQRRAAKQRGE